MMTLQALLASVPELSILNDSVFEAVEQQPVVSITSDSRQVRPGVVFVALTGSHTDGHQYLTQAAENGALAVVVQSNRPWDQALFAKLPVLSCDNTYKAFGDLASAFYGFPGRQLTLVGVTGTNGKTTVTHLIEKILHDAGYPVGLIGTLGARAHDESQQTPTGEPYQTTGHTTPMAFELQGLLAEMARRNKTHVVMEVSSHALDQHRVAGCDYRVAVITNLTQDHLDYHKTMDHYAASKAKLFAGLTPAAGARAAVINADDAYAETFIKACPAGVTVLTYGLDNPQAAIRAENVEFGIDGATFTVITPAGNAPVALNIAGRFNIYNALAAIGAGLALELPLAQCLQALRHVSGVRGRFEVVANNPSVIVDYAHTPDGLQNVLTAARKVTPMGGRLIAVFGCGGDRDATKRPKMGRIVEALADVLVITSDNPRSEDPQQIITDILSGIDRFDPARMIVNADREQAIHQAIDLAKPYDLIVVAGKGHEDYQILADRTIHFDDREVVQAYLAGKTPAASGA